MNERIKDLVDKAKKQVPAGLAPEQWLEVYHAKFAELIVKECLKIVKSNTYGPCGEYDYSYSDKSAAADERAETIHEEIASHFGVEE